MLSTYRSIGDLVDHGYLELADPDNVFLSPEWLTAEEFSSRHEPVYLTTEDGDCTITAVLPCFLLDETSAGSPFLRADTFLAELLDDPPSADLRRATLPNLVCGGRRSSHTAVPVRPGLAPAAREGLVRELVHSLDEAAARLDAASITFLYVPETDHTLRESLLAQDYLELASHPNNMLAVPEHGFDEYLRTLSPRRAQSIRREQRRLAAAGVTSTVETCTDVVINEMAPLQVAHDHKYGAQSDLDEVIARHRLLRTHLGADYLVVTARTRDGRLRGFATLIPMKNTLHVREVGRDYHWEPSLPIYFESVFYTPIRYAAARGYRIIDYSISADQVKQSRGCYSQRRFAYLKLTDRCPQTEKSELERLLAKVRPPEFVGAQPGEL